MGQGLNELPVGALHAHAVPHLQERKWRCSLWKQPPLTNAAGASKRWVWAHLCQQRHLVLGTAALGLHDVHPRAQFVKSYDVCNVQATWRRVFVAGTRLHQLRLSWLVAPKHQGASSRRQHTWQSKADAGAALAEHRVEQLKHAPRAVHRSQAPVEGQDDAWERERAWVREKRRIVLPAQAAAASSHPPTLGACGLRLGNVQGCSSGILDHTALDGEDVCEGLRVLVLLRRIGAARRPSALQCPACPCSRT